MIFFVFFVITFLLAATDIADFCLVRCPKNVYEQQIDDDAQLEYIKKYNESHNTSVKNNLSQR